MSKGNIILRGITGFTTPGVIVGKVRIINGDKTKLANIQPGDVVVIKDVDPATFDAHEAQLRQASCIIKDNGGLSAHEIMRSLVWNIPSMFATETNLDMKEATKTLKDGQTVRVETFVGTFDQFNPKLQKNITKKWGAIYEEIGSAPSSSPTPTAGTSSSKIADILAKYKTMGK